MKKIKQVPSGYNAECWVVVGCELNFSADNGYLRLRGYKDFAAKEAGTEPAGPDVLVPITGISALSSATAVQTDIVGLVQASAEFEGATLETIEVPDPVEGGE